MPDNDDSDVDGKSEELVGYGRPPRNTRWRKGQSGNPSGRPKGSRNLHTEVIEALTAPVEVIVGGKTVTMSKFAAVLNAAIARAKSDNTAFKHVSELGVKLGAFTPPEQVSIPMATEVELELLRELLGELDAKDD